MKARLSTLAHGMAPRSPSAGGSVIGLRSIRSYMLAHMECHHQSRAWARGTARVGTAPAAKRGELSAHLRQAGGGGAAVARAAFGADVLLAARRLAKRWRVRAGERVRPAIDEVIAPDDL